MSESQDEAGHDEHDPAPDLGSGIPDEALPADLQPGEDNPLAAGLEDQETVDDLLSGGKRAEQDQVDPEQDDPEQDDPEQDDPEQDDGEPVSEGSQVT